MSHKQLTSNTLCFAKHFISCIFESGLSKNHHLKFFAVVAGIPLKCSARNENSVLGTEQMHSMTAIVELSSPDQSFAPFLCNDRVMPFLDTLLNSVSDQLQNPKKSIRASGLQDQVYLPFSPKLACFSLQGNRAEVWERPWVLEFQAQLKRLAPRVCIECGASSRNCSNPKEHPEATRSRELASYGPALHLALDVFQAEQRMLEFAMALILIRRFQRHFRKQRKQQAQNTRADSSRISGSLQSARKLDASLREGEKGGKLEVVYPGQEEDGFGGAAEEMKCSAALNEPFAAPSSFGENGNQDAVQYPGEEEDGFGGGGFEGSTDDDAGFAAPAGTEDLGGHGFGGTNGVKIASARD
eukprot:CAMPEP_0206415584 /NCGR_PEP_ID=MMETSP0294-20121207/36190_1 /ASSEMBLY_ACC=CAM_ASM_000327 /TAXON_ID=39354 /ORGANISM="Heterosigma akashiwo, Strain CCMP2393" /LENGTH=355 /DNA_ID=CAMNT_0053877979 /DNA_START=123 /DNA_END=1188 /DNA_ORIENTATION=-